MQRHIANHVRPGMNDAKAQGKNTGFSTELANEPLTSVEKLNNKKTKKRQ